ncbi:hypothetical protein [Thalassospira xiamenensis]|uniref:hypothetical protein n=1 Tax=Thalassospira xiamenensis TaxID=220697 RepID=UPI000DEE0FB4|nr:hypothetical protein [Thalassospira xiamenensis]RCK42615.1 hypothetical protein TH24_00110 [Thalassospira xiamenensis]
MVNEQIRPMGARNPCLLAAIGILTLSGCGSVQNSQLDTKYETWTASYTLVGEGGVDCTGNSLSQAQNESFAAVIAVPLVASLAKQGLNAIGAAFKAAGETSKKTLETPLSSLTLATINMQSRGDGLESIEVSHQSRCIRVAVVEMQHDAKGNIRSGSSGGDTPSKLNNIESIEARVLDYLNDNLHNRVKTVHLYAAYFLSPRKTVAGEMMFEVSPKFIWYNRSVYGARYNLAAINFKIITPGGNKAEDVKLAFLHDFAPNGLSPGSFMSEATGTLSGSRYLPAPALSDAEAKTVEQLQSDLLISNGVIEEPDLSENHKKIIATKKELLDKKSKIKLDECVKNNKTPNSISLCQIDLMMSSVDEDLGKNENYFLAESQISKIGEKINNTGPLGYFNAQFEVIESRRPNELYLAVARALTESKASHESAIDAYVKDRLDPEDKPSKSVEDGDYLLALYDYDKAQETLEMAKIEGNSSTIANAERDLIVKYNDLRKKAEKAGRSFTLSPPYP